MSKANSTLQDRTIPQQLFQPDPLPPNTKIIECSCNNAERRSDDNSEWVNILKEPILIKKGSEIRVQQSAIDMTGIDGDIIQFQNDTIEQDNSHTLLCQHYTVNDGTNGKTCTYDYMGANKILSDVVKTFHLESFAPTPTDPNAAGNRIETLTFNVNTDDNFEEE